MKSDPGRTLVRHSSRACARAGAILTLSALAACEAIPFGLEEAAATINVTVVRGPTDPVAREGQLGWEPVAGARVGARPSFGDVTRHAATDVWGIARFQVPAGAWIIAVETCTGAIAPPPAQAIDVQAGTFAAVRFECDTGIR